MRNITDTLNNFRASQDSFGDLFNDVCVCVCGSHLAQNPFICDCHLKWLADYLQDNPIETSGARCTSPRRLANKRIGQIKSKKFRCSGTHTHTHGWVLPAVYKLSSVLILCVPVGTFPSDSLY